MGTVELVKKSFRAQMKTETSVGFWGVNVVKGPRNRDRHVCARTSLRLHQSLFLGRPWFFTGSTVPSEARAPGSFDKAFGRLLHFWPSLDRAEFPLRNTAVRHSMPGSVSTLFERFFMANIKSQKKRNKTNEIRRQRNVAVRSRVKSFIKKADSAMKAGDAELIEAAVPEALSEIDRAVSKGVLHHKAGARRKSSLQRRVAEAQKA